MTEETVRNDVNPPKLLSPFLWRELKCPICNTAHNHRMFRVRQFLPKTTEADQHVSEYKWMAETSYPVHPPYYALYHCPDCYYTDIMADYRYGLTTPALHLVGKRFQQLRTDGDPLLQFLGSHIDYDAITYPVALNMHYLAVYIQLMAPEDVRDAFKIGRFFLRIAWMFRERDRGQDIPDGPLACVDQPFYEFPNHAAFLDALAALWPEAPATEAQAMRQAATWFEAAIYADSRFDEPKEYYAGIKLLMEILRRCGDYDHAYEVIRGIYNTAMETRQKHSDALKNPETSERMRTKIATEGHLVNKMMSDAAEMRDEILGFMVERDLEQGRAIAAALPGASVPQLLTKLVAAGLRPEVARRMVNLAEFKNGR